MNGQKDRQTDGERDRQTDRQMDRQTDGQTERQMQWAGRQTDRGLECIIVILERIEDIHAFYNVQNVYFLWHICSIFDSPCTVSQLHSVTHI